MVDLRINGVKIKEPKPEKFSVSQYNLTKSGRSMDGTMNMQTIRKVTKLFFTYEIITDREMRVILDQIMGDNPFFEVSFVENGRYQKFTGYVGEVKHKLFRSDNLGGWYWKGFEFNIIER